MQSKNILYIADPNSIHDFKWISFFSTKDEFNCFLVGEKGTYANLSVEQKNNLKSAEIHLLCPIDDFSFTSPFKTLKAILILRQVIKENEIDTVHALFGSPQPIWFNFLPSKKKLMITNRGSDVLVLIKELYDNKAKILNKLLYKLIKRGFQKSTYVTCTSSKQIDYLKVDVLKQSNEIQLIKTGVDVDRIEKHDLPCDLDIAKDKKIVFSIRYIGEVYNMDYQLEGIKKLRKETLDKTQFVFVRGDSCGDILYNEFKSGLGEINGLNYHIEESLNQKEVWSMIKRSDLIYMVPKSDGTPNSALEAMASKKPFLMGNLDYNKELFENVCLIADLSNPESLADKIEEGLNCYPKELIFNGFRKVSKFGSRDSEMNKLLKLYQE